MDQAAAEAVLMAVEGLLVVEVLDSLEAKAHQVQGGQRALKGLMLISKGQFI